MTWTAYWRGIMRSARTGLDIYVGVIVHAIVSGFVEISAWYILPLAAIVGGAFKVLRDKNPDSWIWKYLPL